MCICLSIMSVCVCVSVYTIHYLRPPSPCSDGLFPSGEVHSPVDRTPPHFRGRQIFTKFARENKCPQKLPPIIIYGIHSLVG